MKQPLDVLIDARKLIEHPENWVQGSGVIRNGAIVCRCAAFALLEAAKVRDDSWVGGFTYEPSLRLACDRFQEVTRCNEIHVWNDKKGRTHEQVLSAFDMAIVAERNRLNTEL